MLQRLPVDDLEQASDSISTAASAGDQFAIELSTLGYEAELIGAAALVMENFEKRMVKEFTPNPTAVSFSNS